MKLKEFMVTHGVTYIQLKALAKISHATITKIINGIAPSLTTAWKIECATKGLVTIYDLIPDELIYDAHYKRKEKKSVKYQNPTATYVRKKCLR